MRLPIILVFLWAVFKTAMLQFGQDSERIGVILNILFIVIIIFMAIRKLKGDYGFFEMIKAGMRPAALYIVLVTIMIFVYYSFLDPGFMPGVVETNMESVQNAIVQEGGFDSFAENHGPLESTNEADYLSKQRETFEMMFSPFARASQSLLALTMLGLFYSLLMVGVYKVARRFIPE
jgi:hypothetical protein